MDKFKNNILQIYGEEGQIWLKHLPQNVQYLENLWSLSQLKPLNNLNHNYVLSGFQQTLPIILKLSPDIEEIEKEAKALRALSGFGAISILNHHNNALLLEKAIPGKSLKSLTSKKLSIEIASKVIEKLQQAPLPEKEVFPHIEECLTSLDKNWNLPSEHLERARRLKKQLLEKNLAREVLLHGDLHQENILSKGDDWIVIDPKGVVGYPINEIWACVENPHDDLRYLADYFHYPFKDVVEWYYVHLILAACWQSEDHLDPQLFLNLATSILPMIEIKN